MKTTDNSILSTGGATGIGFALARAWCDLGNRVAICGRREVALNEARRLVPQLETLRCDIGDPADRLRLLEWSTATAPDLNILVNNAGIQRQIDFTRGPEELSSGENEVIVNFDSAVQLCALFIPHLLRQREAAIVNVSSGLGFTPLAILPVYCATKAALHSFSLSLRHQLAAT